MSKLCAKDNNPAGIRGCHVMSGSDKIRRPATGADIMPKQKIASSERAGIRFSRNLDWNLLKVFHEIVTAGGISKAAGELARKQPSVSQALNRLEDRLQSKLCQRGPSGFELTDTGRAAAATCAALIQMIRNLPEGMADGGLELRGRFRLGLISNLVCRELDEALSDFHLRHGGVEFIFDVAPWTDIIDALLRDEIEIGIAPSHVKRAELDYHFLFCESHRPYCGRRSVLFGRDVIDPHALADHEFILTGSDEPAELTEFRLQYGHGIRSSARTEHLEEAKRLTLMGVGLCYLPEGLAQPDVDAGRLWPLLGRDIPRMDVFVIHNPKGSRQAIRRRFIEALNRSKVSACPE
jgi:DNA-binding transcriptional LysR family regulator